MGISKTFHHVVSHFFSKYFHIHFCNFSSKYVVAVARNSISLNFIWGTTRHYAITQTRKPVMMEEERLV